MLNNKIRDNELFVQLSEIADSMNMYIVDTVVMKVKSGVHVSITICMKEGLTGIDECALFHRTVQSLLELKYGRDNLSMEVSTPGLQHVFNDCWEFTVFKGKQVRLYNIGLSAWVVGTIVDNLDNSVILEDVLIEDGQKKEDRLIIEYKDIQKAKLEFVFASAKEKLNV